MRIEIDFPKLEDIKKMVELDQEVFHEELLIEGSSVFDWYYKNKYQWLIEKDEEGNLLGYISIWHISKNAFDKLVAGEFRESDITSSDIIAFGEQNEIYCSIGAFVSKNSNTRVAISLINKIIKYVRFLKENDVIIKKIATVPVSDIGYKLSQKLGFKKVGETRPLLDGSKEDVFVLDLEKESFSHLINEIKKIFL